MEEKYRYADEKQQLIRANRFFTVGNILFYFFVAGIVCIACARGIRSMGYTSLVMAIILLNLVMAVVMNRRNGADVRIRYVSSILLVIVTFLVAYAFDSYYLRFMAAIPFVGCIIYFDKRFSKIFGIVVSAVNILVSFLKIVVMHDYAGEDILDQICATFAICLLMFLIYYTVAVGYRFNTDTLGRLRAEKAAQGEMLDDVVAVAQQVRKGTEQAMNIVGELNDSTGVVSGAVKDISDSTLSTAENIQTQTVMTQNIQEAIGETINHSENMVATAKESEALNEKSMEIMEHIKKQSGTIADTNAEVAASMQRLQEKTNAVKGIADTIFSISSQTNLLALNASIESARAGEAGRGFAVVADEIRQLAEKTRQETENIASILEQLSNDAKSASDAVEASVSATGQQDELIAEASESFGTMNRNVNELTNNIAEIDKMLTNLAEANNQIVDNITQLSATTEEVTASSQQAAQLSVGNLDNAESTKALLDDVLKVSYELDKYLEK